MNYSNPQHPHNPQSPRYPNQDARSPNATVTNPVVVSPGPVAPGVYNLADEIAALNTLVNSFQDNTVVRSPADQTAIDGIRAKVTEIFTRVNAKAV